MNDGVRTPRRALLTILTCLQIYVIVGGFVSFVGWAADVPRLTDWHRNGISIQPNTTIAVMSAGVGLALLTRGRRRLAAVVGSFVAFIGSSALFQHFSGLDLGIDTPFMFGRTWGRVGVLSPGRMGPTGATCWTLIGIGLVLTSFPRGSRVRRAAATLAVITASISGLGLIGYLYGASNLYSLPHSTIIALQTASFILAVSLGLVMNLPERGLMRVLSDSGAGGVLARRILPGIVMVPILIGFVRLQGERAGLYDTAFGSSIRTLSEILLFMLFLWWTGAAINRHAKQRERADLASRVSQKRVIDTLESITDAFVTFDPEWRFTYVNAEAERLLRKSRRELLGRIVWDVFPESRMGGAYEELRRVAAERVSRTFEEFNRSMQRWFMNKAYSTPDGSVAVYFEDVTERKEAEEELGRSRAQLEAELNDTKLLQGISTELLVQEHSLRFYESIVDTAVQIMRSDFGSLQVLDPGRGSSGELELLAHRGFSAEAAASWKWVGTDTPSACGAALRAGTRVIVPDVDQCSEMDSTAYRKAGIRAAQSTPLVSRSGAILGMISTHWGAPHKPPERELQLFDILARQAADLIERKRAEETIAALNAQLSSDLAAMTRMHEISSRLVQATDVTTLLQEIIDAAVEITEADMGNIQLLEEGTLRIAAHRGFKPPFLDFFGEVPGGLAACGTALLFGRRVIVEDVTKNSIFAGSPALDVLLNANARAVQSTPLVSRSGQVLGMFSTHYHSPHQPNARELRMLDMLARQAADLTERRQTETQREELLERERSARSDAERAARLKDEFLATLSHELRTPLNAVIGWSQILKKDLVDPDKVRAVEVIERNGRLQAQLITDLLDISRVISGKMRLDIQPVNLEAVIEAAIDSIMPAADAKGVRIQRILDCISESMLGDPARLQQVVWNLLSNAVKFTARGGSVQVALVEMNSHVEIRVSDTGEGIAPEFVPHIFERFRQADASVSRSHGGLGLGLALVKQFVELHGGKVRAASDGKGMGATFVIELPIATESEEKLQEVQRPPERKTIETGGYGVVPLKGVKVLLVDDEPDALAMIRRMLEDSEATVYAASSSRAALDLLTSEAFDVIVSDIGMPNGDGYELISEVRTRGIATPALALTAFARTEDQLKAMSSGYQAHVSKPVETDQFLGAVAALVIR